jgi:hypothetical protein
MSDKLGITSFPCSLLLNKRASTFIQQAKAASTAACSFGWWLMAGAGLF